MATFRGFNNARWVSKIEQASFLSAATVDAILYSNADPLQITYDRPDSTDLVAIASEEATDQTILSRKAEGPEDLPRLRPCDAAFLLSYALGNVNQSPVDEPASGYYTHTITPRPTTFLTSAQDGSGSPVTTLAVEDTASWPSTGSLVTEASGTAWAYTGKSATTFTGVSITDNMLDNAAVHLAQPDNDYTLPVFTLIDNVLGAQRRYLGCMLQRLEISGERRGFVRAAGQIIASGSSSVTTESAPSAVTEVYLKTGDATITRSGTWNGTTFSSGTSIRTDVRSFRWVLENEIPDDMVYTMGSGYYMGRAERLRRRQSLEIEMEYDDHTELNWMLNQTAINLIISLAGPVDLTTGTASTYAVKLIFPQLKISSVTPSGGTGVLVKALGAAVQQHATYGSVFAQVINQQQDYLHV